MLMINPNAYNPEVEYTPDIFDEKYDNDNAIIEQIKKKFGNFIEQLNKEKATLDDLITVLTNIRFLQTDLKVHAEEAKLGETESRLQRLKQGIEEVISGAVGLVLMGLDSLEENCLMTPLPSAAYMRESEKAEAQKLAREGF